MSIPFLAAPLNPPRGPAVVDPGRNVHLTYPELRRAVRREAGRLAELGVVPGSTVALLMDDGPRTVVIAHATWFLGAALAPLHRREPDETLARRVEELDPVVLIVDEAGTRRAEGWSGVRTVGAGDSVGPRPRLEEVPREDVPAAESNLERPALILYTSGTTGTPRGVVLSAGNLRAGVRASDRRLGHTPSDRWLNPLPFYHMGGLAPIVRCGLNGSTVVISPPDVDAVGRILREQRITGVSLVPTQLHDALEEGMGLNRPGLRFLLVGGAATPPALLRRCRRNDVPVRPTYGATETTSQVATAAPWEVGRDPTTVGRPLPGVTVRILDDDGEVRAAGQPGEITVRGPTVMLGYHRADGSIDRDRLGPQGFRTGDHGYLDDEGRLHVLGRASDRIVTGGETVDPREVRDVLREHPSVRDAAVVGLDHARWGERVAALLEPEKPSGGETEEILRHCEQHLADFKRPGVLAWTSELPRTGSGTVDRGAVRDRLRSEARENA